MMLLALVIVAALEAPTQAAPSARAPEELSLPDGVVSLGTVRVPRAVMADGQRLGPGTYRLRLTAETARPDVAGQLERLERWVEFVQGKSVRGRALATIVPAASIGEVAESRPPRRGAHRIDRLTGGEYLRIWFNRNGDHVLLHLPLETGRS